MFFCFNYLNFLDSLRAVNFDIIYRLKTIEDNVIHLNEIKFNILNIHVPFVTARLTKPTVRWLSNKLKCLMKNRNIALDRFKNIRKEKQYYF